MRLTAGDIRDSINPSGLFICIFAGYSVKELQNIFGFATPQAVYKWQHGAALPTVDNLVLLSVIFKVSIDEILVIESGDDATLSASV